MEDGEGEDEEVNKYADIEDAVKDLVVEEEIIPIVLEELRFPYSEENGEFFTCLNEQTNEPEVRDPSEQVVDPHMPEDSPSREKCCHKWEDIDELMMKLNEKEKRIESLEINVEELGRMLAESKQDKSSWLDEKRSQEKENIKLMEENGELLTKIDTLEKRSNTLDENNRILTEEKKKAEFERDSLKEKNKKLAVNNQVELKNIQDKYQEANKTITKIQRKLDEAKENLKDSNSNVNALVGQVKLREQEREELEKR